MTKVLNLYAGIGGNRKLWTDVEVTAVEFNPMIAAVYQKLHPKDTVVVGDAHQYLLENFKKFDFIWGSPPCQTHSRMNKFIAKAADLIRYPKMELYQEILLLKEFFKGGFVIENVIPYYQPLIAPTCRSKRHLFWSSFRFVVNDIHWPSGFFGNDNKEMMEWLGMHFTSEDIPKAKAGQVLRNCVHPKIGLQIFNKWRGANEYESDSLISKDSLFEKISNIPPRKKIYSKPLGGRK